MNITTSTLTFADYWDHFLVRWGVNRMAHRVEPGLYTLGNPNSDSPVFVTANYTLSFDALRSALAGKDAYILVLNTQGINVWCAAGKGTFGTDELVNRIEATGLCDFVKHRVVIVPQLGAPGIAAHEVKKRTTFKVEYGPVRASDLLEYLTTRVATPEMRRVRFDLRDRLAVIPVELVFAIVPLMIAAAIAFLFGGVFASLTAVVMILVGVALFPIVLPFLPTHDFSTKGFILGALVAVPFVVMSLQGNANGVWWLRAGKAIVPLLIWSPVTAFLALNFTGSTTFTSRAGVRREIFAYVPAMAWTFGIGIALMLGLSVLQILGA